MKLVILSNYLALCFPGFFPSLKNQNVIMMTHTFKLISSVNELTFLVFFLNIFVSNLSLDFFSKQTSDKNDVLSTYVLFELSRVRSNYSIFENISLLGSRTSFQLWNILIDKVVWFHIFLSILKCMNRVPLREAVMWNKSSCSLGNIGICEDVPMRIRIIC